MQRKRTRNVFYPEQARFSGHPLRPDRQSGQIKTGASAPALLSPRATLAYCLRLTRVQADHASRPDTTRGSALCFRHTAHDATCLKEKITLRRKAAAQMTDQREGMRTGAAVGGLYFSGTMRRLSGVEVATQRQLVKQEDGLWRLITPPVMKI